MKTHTLLSLLILTFTFTTYSYSNTIDSLFNKSKAYLYANPKEASFILDRLLKDPDIKDSLARADILYHYGLSSNMLGSFDEAIDSFYKVLKFSPNPETKLNILANMQISGSYCSLQDYGKAFEYSDKALSFAKIINDSSLIANCHNNRGLIHYNLGEFTVADQFFLTALSINRKIGSIKAVAANLNNMCLYEGNTIDKLTYIDEAIILNKNLNAEWSLCENFNNKGKQLFYLKNYSEAIKLLKETQLRIKKLGAKELECDNYEYLSWIYASIGDYQNAYNYQSRYLILANELQGDQKLRSVERSLASKEMLEKEQYLQDVNHKLRVNKLHRNIIFLMVALAIIIMLSVIVPLWTRKKKKLELIQAKLRLEQYERELAELKINQQSDKLTSIEEDLSKLNHELTTYALLIKNRNDILLGIQNQLKKVCKMPETKVKGELKSLVLFIQQYQSNNQQESIILDNIDEMNRAYLNRLSDRHPDLTNGERKMATLLRVNLSTKEIALLLGVNTNSVNMGKYRLKKALGLDKDADLSTYLASI